MNRELVIGRPLAGLSLPGIQRLSQREVNETVGELVRCHTRETEFDIVDQPSDRRTLRHE